MSSLPDNDATPVPIYRLAINKEAPLYSTVISAIVYGFVLAISGKCFKLLLQTKYIYSKRMQKFLFSYTIVMLLMSTGTMVARFLYIQGYVSCPAITDDIEGTTTRIVSLLFLNVDNPVFLPITAWGADGLMIWRSWTLYNGISRWARVAIFFILGILAIVSLAGGLIYMLTPIILATLIPASRGKVPGAALGILFLKAARLILKSGVGQGVVISITQLTIVVTVFTNAVLAVLIVARILYHQRHLRQVFGVEHRSPYTRIITICVESCFLIVATGILYISLFLWQRSKLSSIAMGAITFTLPHVCVISPLLIIARVAQGRVATAEPPSESEIQVASLRFNNVSGVVGETTATTSR